MRNIFVYLLLVLFPLNVLAADDALAKKKTQRLSSSEIRRTPMTENKDGDLKSNEYEVISTNGAITRAFCPYTCAMRELPSSHCRTWRSQTEPSKCYVEDTRLKTDAIRWGEEKNKK